MIVAVDGPAASGKGTLARRIAAHYGLDYLDTGALYRAVARDVLKAGGDPADETAAVAAAKALDASTFGDPVLRTRGMGEAASIVARIQAVRAVLLQYQRSIAGSRGGAVLDGRDIGTVVCPDADVKLFVTAAPAERARRRHAELTGAGSAATFEEVLAEVELRDARDRDRSASPLKQARDAHLLDTTNLDIEAAFVAACAIIAQRQA